MTENDETSYNSPMLDSLHSHTYYNDFSVQTLMGWRWVETRREWRGVTRAGERRGFWEGGQGLLYCSSSLNVKKFEMT